MPSVLIRPANTFEELSSLDALLSKAIGKRKLPESKFLDTEWIDKQPTEIVNLICKLENYLCFTMINDTGQHSQDYYRARSAGYKLTTGEKDSHGPLSTVYTSLNDKWKFCFG